MSNEDPKNMSAPENQHEEEVVHLDDTVIARAFRWSALALTLIVIGVVGIVIYARRKPAPAAPKMTTLAAPVTPERAEAKLPTIKFTDVTSQAGIRFVHNNGAYNDKLLPETMGGGVAFFDFDNDGAQDLLFINSAWWPWHVPMTDNASTLALYHNDGKGHFKDVTIGSGLDESLYGMGVAVGDYDNDGLSDVFVTGVGVQRLFRNSGRGKFQDLTIEAGVTGATNDWSTSAAWIDIDNDGDLDLFVCNYVRWSKEIDLEVGYKIDGVTRAYGQPMNFQGTYSKLYRNEGSGKFADISKEAGIQINNTATGVPTGKSLGVAPIDLDNDGWIDLVVANDTVQNFVFHNQRNGTFKEIGARSGIAFDSNGNTRGAMGIDAAYYRNDQSLGVAIGNFANEMSALYVSSGSLLFNDEAIPEGVGPASRLLLKFGVFFFDYDLDGRLDLLTANGHLEEEISKIQRSQTYAQPAQLFWNTGANSGATFVPVGDQKAGRDLFKPIVGRGSAFADIDSDGDVDVVLTQVGGAPLLLRNDQNLKHHWVRLKLVGRKSNRCAIGAQIKLHLGEQTLTRQVMAARSYLSQSELPVTIGLGSATRVDSVEILWPGGSKQTVRDIKIDALTTIEQAQ
jgi:enediyne biosynthesis protein E4